MAVNNPYADNAATVQGPGPTGQEGWPTPVVPATGSGPFPVAIVSGGGGPVTIADGADVAEGATTDAAVTTDANGTISGKLRGLVKILSSVWDSLNGRLKVDGSAVTQPVSGTVTANQGGAPWAVTLPQTVQVSASYTRPNDTTAYSSGDVISNSTTVPVVLTFTGCARAAGLGGHIRGCIFTSDANIVTVGVNIRLDLFTVAPPAQNDNAVLAITDADLLNLLPILVQPFSITNAGAGAAGNQAARLPGSSATSQILDIPFVTGGTANLFGILSTNSAFTPFANQVFSVKLLIDQN